MFDGKGWVKYYAEDDIKIKGSAVIAGVRYRKNLSLFISARNFFCYLLMLSLGTFLVIKLGNERVANVGETIDFLLRVSAAVLFSLGAVFGSMSLISMIRGKSPLGKISKWDFLSRKQVITTSDPSYSKGLIRT